MIWVNLLIYTAHPLPLLKSVELIVMPNRTGTCLGKNLSTVLISRLAS